MLVDPACAHSLRQVRLLLLLTHNLLHVCMDSHVHTGELPASPSHAFTLFAHCAAPLEQLGGCSRFKDTSAVDEEGEFLICFPSPDFPRHTAPSNCRPSAHEHAPVPFILPLPFSGCCFLVVIFDGVWIHFIAIEQDLFPNKLSFSDSLCTEWGNPALSLLQLTHKLRLAKEKKRKTGPFSFFLIGFMFSLIAHVLAAWWYCRLVTSIPSVSVTVYWCHC